MAHSTRRTRALPSRYRRAASIHPLGSFQNAAASGPARDCPWLTLHFVGAAAAMPALTGQQFVNFSPAHKGAPDRIGDFRVKDFAWQQPRFETGEFGFGFHAVGAATEPPVTVIAIHAFGGENETLHHEPGPGFGEGKFYFALVRQRVASNAATTITPELVF